uniref:Uncharacterized protein n=1 Tax=Sipha flava TaxID=143950 RepID=A0A2S2QAF6_9HEMI
MFRVTRVMFYVEKRYAKKLARTTEENNNKNTHTFIITSNTCDFESRTYYRVFRRFSLSRTHVQLHTHTHTHTHTLTILHRGARAPRAGQWVRPGDGAPDTRAP